ncbi:type II toxin-antitoxin system Phd/YefM family antitoxin [Microbacterium marinilacus]|uniref:Antitoxin n=1 Tax=Microbacterium marinilacus TaxID=415209 RepID=A0ABP7BH30_9MICO|nr:type II toxin-antitoxin system prevent-host-death family antitoxin [Microbacterium marinilacus]MBY0689557.1 type II toxin-antitoxin system prevent-host-death family antitoxin [Microbacterium marinilacus]
MNVDTIGIRELRNGLSRHLAEVREGAEITVTDHGRPIAKIVPIDHESGLERLIREGIARRPSGPRQALPDPIEIDGTVSDLIAEQRR